MNLRIGLADLNFQMEAVLPGKVSPLIPAKRGPALEIGWNGPPDRPAGVALCCGYGARQLDDNPCPFQPTELIPFRYQGR